MFKFIVHSRAHKILFPMGLAMGIILAGWILPIINIGIEFDFVTLLLICVGWMVFEIYFTVLAYFDYEARTTRNLQGVRK